MKTRFFALAALALALVACNNENENLNGDPVAALFTANIAPATRASGTTWTGGDRIGITDIGNDSQYGNVPFILKNGKFEAEGKAVSYTHLNAKKNDVMKSTFSIIFYLKRQVVKKDGTVPVMGRITVDGTQSQFSCKTTANPNLWDTKGGRMIGKSMQALEVNRKLDKMRVSISKHYQEIMDRDNFVTADKVKNAFLGLEYRCHTLMKVYFQSRDEMEKQYKAGIKSLSSFTRYRIGCAYVGEFLQSHYHVKDIALKELSLPFITDYETFLRTEKHLKINSAMVFVRNLRAMVFRAIDDEWLVKDPFRRYEYKEEETTREFLTKEEIRLLMEIPITRKKMSMVRDLFLFCCFTGLAFIDLYNLKEENIKTFFDDGEWIIIHRQKTRTEADIKLLDYPKQIMEKYRGLCEDGRVFPVPNYKSCMDSLKRLGKKCGITKPLSCAHEPSFVRNLGLPLQRSSNRNREFNAWSQEHKDNPGVCQDYQGKIEQRRGKVVSANK